MKNTMGRLGRFWSAAILAGLLFPACTSIIAVAQVAAGGSTFAAPLYEKWIEAYHKKHPDVQITYAVIGSGLGIRHAIDGSLDVGASDGPMTNDEIAEFRQDRGVNVLHFPTVLGADVPSYNVPGVTGELNFTPAALAGIFLGKITHWNDPELVNANPSANLPSNKIVVVHRSDGSGTTYVWADYLSKVSPEWKATVGTATSINWPVGRGAKGNAGVAGLIEETPYSISYVELIFAIQHKLAYGRVRNSAGVFIKANLASVTAAAAVDAKNMPDDFRVSIINPPEKAAYPISSDTWLLIPDKIADPKKKAIIVDFLKWALTQGQTMTASLSYAQLPMEVVAKEMKAIPKIQ